MLGKMPLLIHNLTTYEHPAFVDIAIGRTVAVCLALIAGFQSVKPFTQMVEKTTTLVWSSQQIKYKLG